MPAEWPWMRFWAEARTDKKLAVLTDAQHRVWLHLLCFASEQPKRGEIRNIDEFELAVECASGNESLLRETLNILDRLNIICIGDGEDDHDTIRFLNWDKRQYDKPSDRPEETAERKRRSREKATRHASLPSNKGVSRDVTLSHDPEKEEELEKELEPEGEQELPAPAGAEVEQPYQVLETLCAVTGRDIKKLTTREKNYSLAVAKRLLADHVTCDEVRGFVGYLQAEHWRTGPITMKTIEEGIGTWRGDGAPPVPKARSPNGTRAGADPMSILKTAQQHGDDWL